MPTTNLSDGDKLGVMNWRLMIENKLGLEPQYIDDPPCIMFLPSKLQGMAQVAGLRKMARGILAYADQLETEIKAEQGGAIGSAEPSASFGPR